jgi:hypothetical protein
MNGHVPYVGRRDRQAQRPTAKRKAAAAAKDRPRAASQIRRRFGDLAKISAPQARSRSTIAADCCSRSRSRRRELIAGERRLRAWALSRFAGQPIPCHVIDVDAIVAGEWDENAQRKDFSPSEAVAIKRTLRKRAHAHRGDAADDERAAPGRKAAGEGTGARQRQNRQADRRRARRLRKAEAVVEAAEREPEKFGDLQAEMDRSGKVNAAHKKLTVRKRAPRSRRRRRRCR